MLCGYDKLTESIAATRGTAWEVQRRERLGSMPLKSWLWHTCSVLASKHRLLLCLVKYEKSDNPLASIGKKNIPVCQHYVDSSRWTFSYRCHFLRTPPSVRLLTLKRCAVLCSTPGGTWTSSYIYRMVCMDDTFLSGKPSHADMALCSPSYSKSTQLVSSHWLYVTSRLNHWNHVIRSAT